MRHTNNSTELVNQKQHNQDNLTNGGALKMTTSTVKSSPRNRVFRDVDLNLTIG